MANKVTVVMYHYVRDVLQTAYPDIKALGHQAFLAQLDYLQQHYHLVSVADVLDSLDTGSPLPAKAALLTFDDGYREHYDFVFPELTKRKLSGCFYPPAEAIEKQKVLDVNKIHFVLACSPDTSKLTAAIFRLLDKARKHTALESNEQYFRQLAVANRFDTAEVIFVKRLLQHALPEPVRAALVKELFDTIVDVPEAEFSRSLYLTEPELRTMVAHGMHVGSHGYSHQWLGLLSEPEQEADITKSCAFLERVGMPADRWTISYPYGSYNQSLLRLVQERGCRLGFTTQVAVAELNAENRLVLPRLDTNDLLPQNAAQTAWWKKG